LSLSHLAAAPLWIDIYATELEHLNRRFAVVWVMVKVMTEFTIWGREAQPEVITGQLGCESDWEEGVASGESSGIGRCTSCGSFLEECNCGPDLIF
jgi:hypothetical protein